MKRPELWKPSKFVPGKDGLRPSSDEKEMGIGSRFIGGLQARIYERAISEHARGVLLDLACGKVPFYGLYRDLVENNVCADYGGTLHKSPCLDHEFDLNQGIPLADENFDTILLTDVLEHIAKPDQLWREVVRVLRPGGKIILGVPFFCWIHEAPHDYFRYTEFRLRMFCEDNGLAVLSLEPYGGAAEVLIDVIAKQIAFSRFLSRIHLFLGRAFVRSLIGKKITRRTRHTFPLGYCLIAQKPA